MARAKVSSASRKQLPPTVFAKVGWLDLPKAGGGIFHRSALEGDVITALQFSHSVARIERNDLTPAERVFALLGSAPADNKVFTLEDGRSHTPDLRLTMTDGRILFVQVGPTQAKDSTEMRELLERVKALACEEGHGFVVLTERVRRTFRAENYGRLLKRSRPVLQDPEVQEQHRKLVDQARAMCESRFPARATVSSLATDLRRAVGSGVPAALCETAVYAVIAEAEHRGSLLCDLDAVRLDLGVHFAISPDEAVTRDWLAAHLEAQASEPLPQPPATITSSVVMPVTAWAERGQGRGPQDSAEEEARLRRIEQRLAVVRDHERNPRDTYIDIAQRHAVDPWFVKYWCGKARRGGESALMEGRIPKGVRAHPRVKLKVRELWIRKVRVSRMKRHPELRAVLREVRGRLSDAQVYREVRWLRENDAKGVLLQQERPRLPLGPFYGDPNWIKQVVVPGQVVQVDEGTVDAFLRSPEGGVLPRGFLLLAVDVATRAIVAWRYCLEKPSEVDYRKLLAMLMTSKTARLTSLGRPIDYPFSVVPQTILADQGWIFTATRLREEMLAMGVRMEHAAPFQPQMKAIIERLLGTVNENFIHVLPGATLSARRRRPTRAVMEEAAAAGLLPEEFETALAHEIVDYHDDPHSGLSGKTPREAWEDAARLYGVEAWPETETARLRLRLFQQSRIPRVRPLDGSAYNALDARIRPMFADPPKQAILLYDKDDCRFFDILQGDGPMAGTYLGQAHVEGIPLDRPITAAELHAIRNPQKLTPIGRPVTTEQRARVRDRLARGRTARPKELVALEKERRRIATASTTAPVPAEDLDLDPRLDYERI